MNAFAIANELRLLVGAFDPETGEYPPEVADRIAELQIANDEKIKGLIAAVKENIADAAAKRTVAQPILDLARAAERRSERLKELLTLCLQAAGIQRATTEFGDCWLQKNPPSMVPTVSPELLPSEFQRVKIEADAAKAKEFYKSCGEVPQGFELKQSQSARIK